MRHDLSSLRLLGSVGEPINPEAWRWYYKNIGHEKCPVMDTWWQTETGGFMITPTPAVPLKPGSGTLPFAGIQADVVRENGESADANEEGLPGDQAPVAWYGAHDMGRPRPLPHDILVRLRRPGLVLHG